MRRCPGAVIQTAPSPDLARGHPRGRSPPQCMHPPRRRAPDARAPPLLRCPARWFEQEDARLCLLVEAHGARNWSFIAQAGPGATSRAEANRAAAGAATSCGWVLVNPALPPVPPSARSIAFAKCHIAPMPRCRIRHCRIAPLPLPAISGDTFPLTRCRGLTRRPLPRLSRQPTEPGSSPCPVVQSPNLGAVTSKAV